MIIFENVRRFIFFRMCGAFIPKSIQPSKGDRVVCPLYTVAG
jgi:hypothetical protein